MIGSDKNLTPEEKYAIDVLADKNLSCREIAVSIERSESAVARYFKNKNVVLVSKPQGRPRKLTPRTVRAVVKKARKGRMTAQKVFTTMGLGVSLRTVKRTLFEDKQVTLGHLKVRPFLMQIILERSFGGPKITGIIRLQSGDEPFLQMKSGSASMGRMVPLASGETRGSPETFSLSVREGWWGYGVGWDLPERKD